MLPASGCVAGSMMPLSLHLVGAVFLASALGIGCTGALGIEDLHHEDRPGADAGSGGSHAEAGGDERDGSDEESARENVRRYGWQDLRSGGGGRRH